MSDEWINRILKDDYETSKEDTLRSLAKEVYSKKMRWVLINVYAWFVVFLVPMIISVIQFFKTNQTKLQIMYAAIFVCCFLTIGLIKVFGWMMFARHGVKREIKRLEFRIAELSELIKPS